MITPVVEGDRMEFIKRVYESNNKNTKLSDKQKQLIRELSQEKERPKTSKAQSNSFVIPNSRQNGSIRKPKRPDNKLKTNVSHYSVDGKKNDA